MPVQTTYPGVYIEELPSGVHTIAGVSTSVTAFVGAASRGPADTPVRIFSFSDYLRTFGPPLDEVSPMGHAVQHFFINGGSEAVIVRALGDNAKAASTTFKETLTTGTDVLTLTAIGRGVGEQDRQRRPGGGGRPRRNGEPGRPVQRGRALPDSRSGEQHRRGERHRGPSEPLDVAKAPAVRAQRAGRLAARRRERA